MAHKRSSCSFKVHDVVPSKQPFVRADLRSLFEPFCNDASGPLKLLAVDQTKRKLVSVEGVTHGSNPKKSVTNGLAAACVSAWNKHYNLELSPDVMWIAIAQGLTAHVNANDEALRSAFVHHEGKEEIILDVDAYGNFKQHLAGKADFDWKSVVSDFSVAVGKRTKQNVRELVECDFSTSSPVEVTVSQLALMDAMQPFFTYQIRCVCGIPKITLTETVDDWKKIRAKAEALAAYDLDWWLQELLPVLDHFVEAREGNPDVHFWQRICRQDGGTGNAYNRVPEFVSGWLSVFFPYDKKGKKRELRWDAPKLRGRGGKPPTIPDPEVSKDQSADYGLRIYNKDIPAGVSSAPVIIGHKNSIKVRVMGGFVGVEQDKKTLTLKPAVSWCVAQCLAAKENDAASKNGPTKKRVAMSSSPTHQSKKKK